MSEDIDKGIHLNISVPNRNTSVGIRNFKKRISGNRVSELFLSSVFVILQINVNRKNISRTFGINNFYKVPAVL